MLFVLTCNFKDYVKNSSVSIFNKVHIDGYKNMMGLRPESLRAVFWLTETMSSSYQFYFSSSCLIQCSNCFHF